ncbi:hypothetical protein QFZ43_001687 [Streptomyces afghaniensis]|nr:hypothetical protein [Streptomyces afghaniensis]
MILKFPGEPAASLELVHRPADGRVDVGSGIDHLAIQVDTLTVTLKTLAEAGLEPEPVQYPGGPRRPKTSWLTDPDGYRIAVVEWPFQWRVCHHRMSRVTAPLPSLQAAP